MNGQWRFTDLEFFALWDDQDWESLPSPLFFTSRTAAHHDFVRELAQTKSDLRRRLDGSFDAVLDVLMRPDIRISVDGSNGRDRDNPVGSVALYAARQGTTGCVVTQLPGETIWHSGGFVVDVGDALRLSNMVIDRMPAVGAGGSDDVAVIGRSAERFGTFDPPESRVGSGPRGDHGRNAYDDGYGGYDSDYGTSTVLDTFDDTALIRSQRLLAAPVDTLGVITVSQGYSRFGPRGICRREIRWRDVEDDGRYVVAPSHPEVAWTVDDERLTTVVNTEIAVVIRAIKDERN